jgi:osmotically-inducible protein OsmY
MSVNGDESPINRTGEIARDRISVTTAGSTLILHGTVGSWVEHREVVAAAWASPGVLHVEDRLFVEY